MNSIEDSDTIGKYDTLYENNYLARLRTILDNYKTEHPEYADVIEETYSDETDFVNHRPVNKIKFTTRLKKVRLMYFLSTIGEWLKLSRLTLLPMAAMNRVVCGVETI